MSRVLSAVVTLGMLTLAACPSDPAEPLQPPDAPASLTATPHNSAVSLTWGAAARAATYNVYRSTTSGQPTSAMTLLASGIEGTTFNAAATNDVLTYFRVTAVNAGGTSPDSAEASATATGALLPATPVGVTATAGNQTVTLAWDDVPGATSYTIYWTTSPGVTTGASSFSTAASTYIHSSAVNGTTYFYAVTARIGGAESALSAEVSATPAALPYISATAMMVAGMGNDYSVQVCTSSSCATPISNATVTIGGTPLAYDGVDTYEAMPGGSLAGAYLELVVMIPPGWGVASGTYRASGSMYTTAPTLTSPTGGAVWLASQSHTIAWTPASPTAGSFYTYALFNMTGLGGMAIGMVAPPATSATIAANSLTAGSYMGFVAIAPTAPISIPNTAGGSGFLISASSAVTTFTVQ